MAADPGDLLIVDTWIPGEPLAYSRPRFNRATGNTFHTKATRDELERVAWMLRAAKPNRCDGYRISVDLTFCRSTMHGVDLDNLVKMVLDAAKGIVWKDDVQVHEILARKYLGVGVKGAGSRFVARILTSPAGGTDVRP